MEHLVEDKGYHFEGKAIYKHKGYFFLWRDLDGWMIRIQINTIKNVIFQVLTVKKSYPTQKS